MSEEIKELTYPELEEEIDRIICNTGNLVKQIGMSQKPTFADDKIKQLLMSLTIQTSHGLIAEVLAKHLQGKRTNILVTNQPIPSLIK
jgi:hypothetical protein